MNRDDLMRMAEEAKMFDVIEGCDHCFLCISSINSIERFAFIFFQAARKEMIKEGWRFCAKGQQTTQYCGLTEQAIRAEREACIDMAEQLIKQFEHKQISQDPLSGPRESYAIRKYQEMIRARNGSETDTE